MEIHRIPVISTAHIDEQTNDILDVHPSHYGAGANYEGAGYFLYLDEPISYGGDPVPECLLNIRDWLRTQQAAGLITGGWVRLDCDADTVPDLPAYDW